MNITDLPLQLFILILEYICDEYHTINGFAVVNRSLSTNLLRKVRKVTLRTNTTCWNSEFERSKLTQMIDNPFLQLEICDMCRILFNPENMIQSVIPDEVKKVNSLTIINSLGKPSNSLNQLVNQMKEINFLTNNLRLMNIDNIECFDEIVPPLQSLVFWKCQRLRSLNFNSLTCNSLRILKLHFCDSLEDVASLDGIYDLELKHCKNVKDISCLGNNYRIKIFCCDNVGSYSKSFKNSRSVHITVHRCEDFLVSLESCHLMAILDINLSYSVRMDQNLYNRSLLFLSLKSMPEISALPPNKLQKVSIISCCNFNSLENMNHIHSIHLEDLNKITTLTGLGPKNQIITLKNMSKFEDISNIKDAVKVEINHCSLLYQRISSLVSVRELKIIPCMSLEHISSLKHLQKLNKLRVLDLTQCSFTEDDEPVIEELRYLMLHALKNVEKFVFSVFYNNIINGEIRNEFIITTRNLYNFDKNVILFVRKKNQKEEIDRNNKIFFMKTERSISYLSRIVLIFKMLLMLLFPNNKM